VDGTMIPHMNILEIKDGKIWRGRVYTDRPQRDGVDISGYTDQVNPTVQAGKALGSAAETPR